MKHNQFNPNAEFVEEPEAFNKYTNKEKLQYCLGAVMYMPATKEFADAIIEKKYIELTSIAMCFEDACEDGSVKKAEKNVIRMLDKLSAAVKAGELSTDEIPLIFFRVRSVQQFRKFSQQLKREHTPLIAGFIFPKFNSSNGYDYLSHLRYLNEQFNEVLYGMPILEDKEIAFKETRIKELLKIKHVLDQYKEQVLSIRVGCTDLSSCFGVRRDPNKTIYDVLTVADCLSDILNVFSRNNDYIVSGPVWEYFPTGRTIDEDKDFTVISGLIKETSLDRVNGFVGKTCIHPTQVYRINAMFAVTADEYRDAKQILSMSSGVVKGSTGMNEAKPHRKWAERILGRAAAYGVIRDGESRKYLLNKFE